MNTVQIIDQARQLLPYTSEFEHEVIRVPVKTEHAKPNNAIAFDRWFYEVEFKKVYIKNVAIGWEFVNIY